MPTKEELLRYTGNIQQIASVRPVVYGDGRAEDLRMIHLKSGYLEAAFMSSKCLDPAWISWRGLNLGFLPKQGLMGRDCCDVDGARAIRTIMPGSMFTCGLDNIHGAQTIDGKDYPTHGTIRTTPAEKVCTDAYFDGDDYKLHISGEMREGALFGDNLVLRRTIDTTLGDKGFVIRDEVENQAFAPAPVSILYHCNFGYPLLEEGCRLVMPSVEILARDEEARAGLETLYTMPAPIDNAPEQVVIHKMAADENGNTFAALVNDRLGIGLKISWNTDALPLLTQWKSPASGDYALAVEPTNTDFGGRKTAGDTLAPLEKKSFFIGFTVLDGAEDIAQAEKDCAALLGR